MHAAAPEVFGPYIVHERLGAGGMATVHRAVKTGIEGFQRPVALKRLLSQYAGDQEFVRGFVREARLASRLHHANIAQTYDLGRVDQTYYIAMELVDGIDLRHVLRHIAYSVGPMPVALTLALMIQVCDALDYAHGFADESGRPLGIVHRDVSPSNVLVGHDGVVKLIDFGIAKASSATLFTASGMLKGKFSYMAPESLDGHTDSRSDLFAVGALLHELLTARPLFKGKTDFDTLDQIKRMQPAPPSSVNREVPPDVDQVVMTALAKNPTQRWQTAGQLRNAMMAIAARPELRANHLDVPRWIAWALAEPARPQAWDEVAPPSNDDPSVMIEVEPAPTVVARPSHTLLAWGPQPPAAQAPTQIAAPAPLDSPVYQEAAAAYNAAEERRRQLEAVVSLPAPAPASAPSRGSRLWIVVVLVLCAGAAVGGFFLVDALM